MITEQFQTVRDVADMLKVGEATVRRWIKDGELRAIDIGRGWRIDPEDLDDFIQQHANRPHSDGKTVTEAVGRATPDAPEKPESTGMGKGKTD
ncbi:MAG: DNA-binding protein [Alphaproteobacteria bacterium HGW-Alphaproteobacteria-5]|nr:MAG: DNA-binding protein [Alphaproteobacteria bacterium HGW-Alphaproteobacteria-5]